MDNIVSDYDEEELRRRFAEQSALLEEIKQQFQLQNEERKRLIESIKNNLEIIAEQNLSITKDINLMLAHLKAQEEMREKNIKEEN